MSKTNKCKAKTESNCFRLRLYRGSKLINRWIKKEKKTTKRWGLRWSQRSRVKQLKVRLKNKTKNSSPPNTNTTQKKGNN